MARLQGQILSRSLDLSPQLLIYATCSVLRCENEALTKTLGLAIEGHRWGPHTHDCDGMSALRVG